jgi:4-oxalocrotonate tautomerase
MPLVEVKLYDRRINDDVVPRVIEKLTDALSEAIGDDVREHTWVLVEGLSPKQWGIGGRPVDVTKPAAEPVAR